MISEFMQKFVLPVNQHMLNKSNNNYIHSTEIRQNFSIKLWQSYI